MHFEVITADEVETRYDGRLKIEDGGVLNILPDDENDPVIWLSPGFWQQIKKYPDDDTRGPSEF